MLGFHGIDIGYLFVGKPLIGRFAFHRKVHYSKYLALCFLASTLAHTVRPYASSQFTVKTL